MQPVDSSTAKLAGAHWSLAGLRACAAPRAATAVVVDMAHDYYICRHGDGVAEETAKLAQEEGMLERSEGRPPGHPIPSATRTEGHPGHSSTAARHRGRGARKRL